MKNPLFYVQWSPANQAWFAFYGNHLMPILGENAWSAWWKVESVCKAAGLTLTWTDSGLYEIS